MVYVLCCTHNLYCICNLYEVVVFWWYLPHRAASASCGCTVGLTYLYALRARNYLPHPVIHHHGAHLRPFSPGGRTSIVRHHGSAIFSPGGVGTDTLRRDHLLARMAYHRRASPRRGYLFARRAYSFVSPTVAP
jgi:hypothetical protein